MRFGISVDDVAGYLLGTVEKGIVCLIGIRRDDLLTVLTLKG
jgi:hypothetical protein